MRQENRNFGAVRREDNYSSPSFGLVLDIFRIIHYVSVIPQLCTHFVFGVGCFIVKLCGMYKILDFANRMDTRFEYAMAYTLDYLCVTVKMLHICFVIYIFSTFADTMSEHVQFVPGMNLTHDTQSEVYHARFVCVLLSQCYLFVL